MGACGVSDPKYPPCVDCGEPDSGTCPAGRCRTCDIDHVAATSTCRGCMRWIGHEDMFGPARDQHTADCPLRDDPECFPRDALDLQIVRNRSVL